LALITLIPFVSNGAYWLHLWFKKWKVHYKNEFEKKQLITIEKYIAIKKEIKEQDDVFEKLFEKKDLEINELNTERNELTNKIVELTQQLSLVQNKNNKLKIPNNASAIIDYEKFKKNKRAFQSFPKIAAAILSDSILPKNIESRVIEYYTLNKIIYKRGGINKYNFADKGNEFYTLYFNETFDKEG
jgi:hypothetical protein